MFPGKSSEKPFSQSKEIENINLSKLRKLNHKAITKNEVTKIFTPALPLFKQSFFMNFHSMENE